MWATCRPSIIGLRTLCRGSSAPDLRRDPSRSQRQCLETHLRWILSFAPADLFSRKTKPRTELRTTGGHQKPQELLTLIADINDSFRSHFVDSSFRRLWPSLPSQACQTSRAGRLSFHRGVSTAARKRQIRRCQLGRGQSALYPLGAAVRGHRGAIPRWSRLCPLFAGTLQDAQRGLSAACHAPWTSPPAHALSSRSGKTSGRPPLGMQCATSSPRSTRRFYYGT